MALGHPAPIDLTGELALRKGSDWERVLHFVDDAGDNVDLSGFTTEDFRAHIRKTNKAETLVVAFSNAEFNTNGVDGKVKLTMDGADTESVDAGKHRWDLYAVMPTPANRSCLAQGRCDIEENVTEIS